MANFLDPGKVDAAMQSMQAAFSSGGQHRTEHVHAKKNKNNDFRDSTKESSHSLISQLRDVISKQNAKHLIKMTRKKTEVRLIFGKNAMFAPGSIEIDPAYFSILGDIAEVLGDKDLMIVVEGHADADGTEESKNWEISAGRAVAVVNQLRTYRNLEEDGLPYITGDQLEAKGMGQFSPASLESGANELNRRVEIVIRGETLNALDTVRQLESNSGGIYGQ